MAVSPRFLFHQGAVLRAMWGGLLRSWLSRKVEGDPAEGPGPELTAEIPPRSQALVDATIRWAGGDPEAWAGTLPPYLHPQWGFPLVVRTLEGLSYPMGRALNAGCAMTMHGPIPADQPLVLRARLERIDDAPHRVILHQRLVTGTADLPEALTVDFQVIVPRPRSKQDGPRPPRQRPTVPGDAREIARWANSKRAGLEYALLTGDFNPIHWLWPAARMAGFGGTILHGFGSASRIYEALVKGAFGGDVTGPKTLALRFTRPLVLPGSMGLYLTDEGALAGGDQPGEAAYLVGTYGP